MTQPWPPQALRQPDPFAPFVFRWERRFGGVRWSLVDSRLTAPSYGMTECASGWSLGLGGARRRAYWRMRALVDGPKEKPPRGQESGTELHEALGMTAPDE